MARLLFSARWQRLLNADNRQITVNRQFYDRHTQINDSDKIAFISRSDSI